MAAKRQSTSGQEPAHWYRGADVPMRVIRRFARAVAERFQPDQIILFGSHAHGTLHADSDVDILIVMPARNEITQATRIRLAVDRCFSMKLIVRTPENLRWRLEEGDPFLREVMSKGKVPYDKDGEGMSARGRVRTAAGAGQREVDEGPPLSALDRSKKHDTIG